MSMSQEEIESLMNELDFTEDKHSSIKPKLEDKSENESLAEEAMTKQTSQAQDIVSSVRLSLSDEILADELLSSIEDTKSKAKQEQFAEEIDNLSSQTNETDDKNPNTDIQGDIENQKESNIEEKIDNGTFPFPVDDGTKVINQLGQVADDSEEKATKIFDVLSNILDYNNEIQNCIKKLAIFNQEQVAMLSSLNEKFPSIVAFNSSLQEANKMGNFICNVNDKLDNGNMEIFQAMELMQYHDINRQKIERVMSVIRKLSNYLNGLFDEDKTNRAEVTVAKHIHGDTDTRDLVDNDDLEELIARFSK